MNLSILIILYVYKILLARFVEIEIALKKSKRKI